MSSKTRMRAAKRWIGALSLWALGAGQLMLGCTGPQRPSGHVLQTAREANLAARFGRLDVAAERTLPEHRRDFAKHHAGWGPTLRVVDVEVSHVRMITSEAADVWVDVAWVRLDEGRLRNTRVRQRWQNPGGGWKLASEQRDRGDVGLLGEPVVVLRPPARSAHFPTQVIR